MRFLISESILQSLLLTLCGEDPRIIMLVKMDQVAKKVKIFILALPWFYQALFAFCLIFLQYSTPPFAWKFRPFTLLPLNKRLALLRRWQTSWFYWKQVVFKLLTSPCLMHLFSEEEVLDAIGFTPSMQERRHHP